MHINAKSSGNTGEVQSESSTTILPQTNMLAAPLIPCPSPVTLTVSKKPFISHRNPSPSSGSETNTTNINNTSNIESNLSEKSDDKNSSKASTTSDDLFDDANNNNMTKVTVSPRTLDYSGAEEDEGSDADADADVEEEEDADDLLELEMKLQQQVYVENVTPKKGKKTRRKRSSKTRDIVKDEFDVTPIRSIPPPLPLLSPVYVPKPVVALNYRGKPMTGTESCVCPTNESIQVDAKTGANSKQLHPLDCLLRSFARAENEQQIKYGHNSNSNNNSNNNNNSNSGSDMNERKSFRNKNILVYDSHKKNSSVNSSDATVDGIEFDSMFESGNLATAYKVPHSMSNPRSNRQKVFHQEYDIQVRNDLHTRGNTQWFFFSVTGANIRKGMKIRFNITNMRKADSICNYGMRPCVYSNVKNRMKGIGWMQGGSDVCYYKGTTQYNDAKGKRRYHYILSFVYEFQHANDKVFFAYNYPYTYTMLQEFLQNIERDSSKRHIFRRVKLCNTLAGNVCDLLTITGKTASMSEMNSRKVVVISARVHPGETVGSWMMHGLIEFLTGTSPEARVLRNHFIFKLVPMLNPDGVINGNYRCSLAGVDLNRRWSKPSSIWHPTIFSLKNLIKKMHSTRGVLLYCDLHGHSKKKNIFTYACCPTSSHKSLIPENITVPPKCNKAAYINMREKSRLFAYIMAHVKGGENSDITLSFRDSTFNVRKGKKSTARVVVWQELGVPQSFTIEASFCGAGNNRFDKKCKVKGKRAYKKGEMNYIDNGGFITSGNADDEQGFTTANETKQGSSTKLKNLPTSPGVKQLYKQPYKENHYTKNDLCGFGRVIGKALVVYYDLGLEVKKMHEHDSEQEKEANSEDMLDTQFRSNMIGLRNRLAFDLRQKLSKQYDSSKKSKSPIAGDHKARLKSHNLPIDEAFDEDDDQNNIINSIDEEEITLELPDSDSESCGSDSEPSADNLDPVELLQLESFNSIVSRVDTRKAKKIKKMRSKAQKNKKREAKKKLNVQKKSKKASYAPPPPKRSIARDYANVGKSFRNPKKSKQKKERTTVLWKESVSLNLFDKAMNNEKLRSTEQKFWLVKSKRDIKAVLSKMSLEQRKDDYNNRNSTKQIKKKQRGYGSDRINRASRETLASAPASLYEGAGLKNHGKKPSKVSHSSKMHNIQEIKQAENFDNKTLKARTRKTISIKPADSDSKSESDESVDQLTASDTSSEVKTVDTTTNSNSRNNNGVSRKSRVCTQNSEKKIKSSENNSRRQTLKPRTQHGTKWKSEKVEFAAYKNTRNLGNDIEFIGIAARKNNLKRTFNKPRQPPPQFRAQSRQSYPGSLQSTRLTHGGGVASTSSYVSSNKTLLSLLQSKPGDHSSGGKNSISGYQRPNSTLLQTNYDSRIANRRQTKPFIPGSSNTGSSRRRIYS